MIRARHVSRDSLNARQSALTRKALDDLLAGPSLPGALCAQADPESWFPEPQKQLRENYLAKQLCWQCPVRDACLRSVLDSEDGRHHFGVWGGYAHAKLQRMRRLWRLMRDCPPPKQGVGSTEIHRPRETRDDRAA